MALSQKRKRKIKICGKNVRKHIRYYHSFSTNIAYLKSFVGLFVFSMGFRSIWSNFMHEVSGPKWY